MEIDHAGPKVYYPRRPSERGATLAAFAAHDASAVSPKLDRLIRAHRRAFNKFSSASQELPVEHIDDLWREAANALANLINFKCASSADVNYRIDHIIDYAGALGMDVSDIKRKIQALYSQTSS